MEKYRMPDEFGMPRGERATPPEPANVPTEFTAVPEVSLSPSLEFDGKSGGAKSEEAKSRHGLIKQIMLMPVAATVATLSIVFSSLGVDPLGNDFLNNDDWVLEEEQEQQGTKDKDAKEGTSKDKGDKGDKGDKQYREVKEYPGDITGVIIDVTYVPTGESYRAEETGEEGLEEARHWVLRQGGDPDTITYVGSEEIYAGREISDDAIIVGDEDNPSDWYVAQGTVTDVYKTVAYFNAYESMELEKEPEGSKLDAFPILVIFVPTGDKYYPTEMGELGLAEAREWVKSIGGDPDSMQFVTIRRDTKYELEDGVLSTILMDFAVYEVTEYADDYGDSDWMPILPNQDPDFAGDYAWSDGGPEWYIALMRRGETQYTFLAAGEGITDNLSNIPGASYDPATNTLTLDHFKGEYGEINLMGNGFTIELIGENTIDRMSIWGASYGGSVHFTGTGSLIFNEDFGIDNGGLILEAEGSESCIMVDQGVTLEIYGGKYSDAYPPLMVKQSNLAQTIYLAPGLEMTAYREDDGASYGPAYEAYDDSTGISRQVVYTTNGLVPNCVRIAPKD